MFSLPLFGAISSLGDRLLFEIDNTFYAQRQMEIYQLVKDNFNSLNASAAIDNTKWKAVLDGYINEMVIYSETQRLGSFSPSERVIEENLRKIANRIEKSSKLKSRAHHLRIEKIDLMTAIVSYLQLHSYLASKASVGNSEDEKLNFEKKKWFKTIKKGYSIRKFDGADQYKKLIPVVEGSL